MGQTDSVPVPHIRREQVFQEAWETSRGMKYKRDLEDASLPLRNRIIRGHSWALSISNVTNTGEDNPTDPQAARPPALTPAVFMILQLLLSTGAAGRPAELCGERREAQPVGTGVSWGNASPLPDRQSRTTRSHTDPSPHETGRAGTQPMPPSTEKPALQMRARQGREGKGPACSPRASQISEATDCPGTCLPP